MSTNEDEWETVPKKKKDRRKKQQGPPTWMLDLEVFPAPESQSPPSILLLVGVPGSGKTTLANTLCRVFPWKYIRVNQDEAGSRQACLELAQNAIDNGMSVVVDRCNVSKSQRKYFLELGVPVDCLSLDIPARTCVYRCKGRMGHQTLQPQDAAFVISKMESDWEPASISEGLRTVNVIADDVGLQAAIQSIAARI